MKQNFFRNITVPLTCAALALHAGLAAFPVNAVETDEAIAEKQYMYDQYRVSVSTTEAKLEYLLGEELDLSGVCIFASFGMNDYSVMGDIFGDELLSHLGGSSEVSVDTSAFDNTKMGIYPIHVYFGKAMDTFGVIVTDGTDTVIQGDANCDDSVDILDALALNKNLLTGEKLSEYGTLNGDMNRDGRLDSADVLDILKYTIQLM